MRILHTGDWHLNHRLGRIDRSDDILANLRRIGEYLETERADVLVVAGDLFCDRSTREDLRTAVGHIEAIFTPFLARGGTIVAVSGNHDSEPFCETLRCTLGLAPGVSPRAGIEAPGRLHIATRPRIVRLLDPADQKTVIPFVLLPYPGAAWLRDAEFAQIGNQSARIQDRIAAYLEQRVKPSILHDGPAILVSHILVRGITTRAGFRLGEEQDVVFEQSDVPTHWAYGAFGHIHQPQEVVAGAPWMRYCGSIERLDLGERADDKSVALIEVGRAGRIGEVRLLPLQATPFLAVDINDAEADLVKLVAKWQDNPERERVLVKANVQFVPGRDNYGAIRRHLLTLFPRLYAVDGHPLPLPAQDASGTSVRSAASLALGGIDLRDIEKTTTAYVTRRLEGDPRQGDILDLLKNLLRNEEVTA